MSFQIHAIDPAPLSHLFNLNARELEPHGAIWVTAETDSGYPCRVSLKDAPRGSKVLLVNYEHHPAQSPYRASHAIYVNPAADRATPETGEIPESIASRLISWRSYNDCGHMLDADVCEGQQLHDVLPRQLNNSKVSYIHLHNARPGCFAARVSRAKQ